MYFQQFLDQTHGCASYLAAGGRLRYPPPALGPQGWGWRLSWFFPYGCRSYKALQIFTWSHRRIALVFKRGCPQVVRPVLFSGFPEKMRQ